MMLTRPSHTCTDTRLQIWNLSDATRLSMSPPDWTWGLLTDRRMSAGAKLELQIVAWSWMSEYVYFHPSYPPVVSRAQVMKPAHTAGITRDKNLASKFSGYISLVFWPFLLCWYELHVHSLWPCGLRSLAALNCELLQGKNQGGEWRVSMSAAGSYLHEHTRTAQTAWRWVLPRVTIYTLLQV